MGFDNGKDNSLVGRRSAPVGVSNGRVVDYEFHKLDLLDWSLIFFDNESRTISRPDIR